jgi:hypothetical protein
LKIITIILNSNNVNERKINFPLLLSFFQILIMSMIINFIIRRKEGMINEINLQDFEINMNLIFFS